LFSKNETPFALKAIATQYKLIAIDAWPHFKDIYNEAMSECKKLGGSKFSPQLGGHLIEAIKFTLGWKVAKWISLKAHKSNLLKRCFSSVRAHT
jgi:hypothetical protein